jgi:hypothetical protein
VSVHVMVAGWKKIGNFAEEGDEDEVRWVAKTRIFMQSACTTMQR